MTTDFNSDKLLQDIVLEFSIVSGSGEDEIRRAAKSDGAIAEIAKTRGTQVSADKVRLIRFALGVYAFPRGGARQGAGRKLGSCVGRSCNKSNKAAKRHNCSVGVGDLVINFGRELYEKTGDNVWCPERGEYIARERYTPTPEGRVLGLSAWTPLLAATSESGGRIRYRLSQQDIQKLEAIK